MQRCKRSCVNSCSIELVLGGICVFIWRKCSARSEMNTNNLELEFKLEQLEPLLTCTVRAWACAFQINGRTGYMVSGLMRVKSDAVNDMGSHLLTVARTHAGLSQEESQEQLKHQMQIEAQSSEFSHEHL